MLTRSKTKIPDETGNDVLLLKQVELGLPA